MYAIWSDKQSDIHGIFEYQRADGTVVLVTAVGDTPDCGCSFPDQKSLGEVTEFVRIVKRVEKM